MNTQCSAEYRLLSSTNKDHIYVIYVNIYICIHYIYVTCIRFKIPPPFCISFSIQLTLLSKLILASISRLQPWDELCFHFQLVSIDRKCNWRQLFTYHYPARRRPESSPDSWAHGRLPRQLLRQLPQKAMPPRAN